MISALEHKAVLSQNYTFMWFSPEPLKPGTTPTLSVNFKSGAVSPVLASVHSPLDVSAVSEDRRSLTAAAATTASSRGLQGEYGAAHYVTESDGHYPVNVSHVEDGLVRIGSPLPRKATDGGVLQWALWTATISASLLAVAERSVPFVIKYTAAYGLDLPDQLNAVTGLLHVVRQPFSTGLNSTALVGMMPYLAALAPATAQGFEGVIAAANLELIGMLRAELAEKGLTEDNVNGPSLLHAHAYLSAAMVYEVSDALRSAALRERATGLIAVALRAVWIDAEGDGVVDGDEDLTHLTGGRGSDVNGGSSSATQDNPLYFPGSWDR